MSFLMLALFQEYLHFLPLKVKDAFLKYCILNLVNVALVLVRKNFCFILFGYSGNLCDEKFQSALQKIYIYILLCMHLVVQLVHHDYYPCD